jgi:carboxypeptidase C (cathepsin A)
VEQSRFSKQLLRDRGRTVGRLDTRFLGTDRDAAGEVHEYDAGFWIIDSPFVSAVHAYFRDELRWEDDRFYERLTDKVFPWEWTGAENHYLDMSEPLRQTMMKNAALKVFFITGAYDMAAPYFETEITIAHMALPPADRSRVRHVMYEAGHMPYLRRVEHHRLKADLAEFVKEALTSPALLSQPLPPTHTGRGGRPLSSP